MSHPTPIPATDFDFLMGRRRVRHHRLKRRLANCTDWDDFWGTSSARPLLGGGEPGCLMIDAYRSTRDPRLFHIHSRWVDEAAFQVHADLANTNEFVARAEALIDHPVDVTRSRPLG